MKTIRLITLCGAFTFGFGGIGLIPAHAESPRTWVSGVGDDDNPCTRAYPCQTFAGAIGNTEAGGEIDCLDAAGFGSVTILKSLTIDCTGTLGGILSLGTTGVVVNGAGIVVTLRGLEISGSPTLMGGNGVRYLQAARLNIEDSTISNFNASDGYGVLVNNTSGHAVLHIRNTVIRNNGTAAGGGGVHITPGGTGTASVVLNHVTISGQFTGIRLNTAGTTGPAGVDAVINNSSIDANVYGVVLNGPTTAANVMLMNSSVTRNTGVGILASGAGSRVRVGNTTVTLNGTGVSFGAGAIVNTFGNNQLIGNITADGAFTLPAIGQQ